MNVMSFTVMVLHPLLPLADELPTGARPSFSRICCSWLSDSCRIAHLSGLTDKEFTLSMLTMINSANSSMYTFSCKTKRGFNSVDSIPPAPYYILFVSIHSSSDYIHFVCLLNCFLATEQLSKIDNTAGKYHLRMARCD